MGLSIRKDGDAIESIIRRLPARLRARDFIAGEDAVKSAGEKYLPRLEAQTDEEYDAYRPRASLFNATARTADG